MCMLEYEYVVYIVLGGIEVCHSLYIVWVVEQQGAGGIPYNIVLESVSGYSVSVSGQGADVCVLKLQ